VTYYLIWAATTTKNVTHSIRLQFKFYLTNVFRLTPKWFLSKNFPVISARHRHIPHLPLAAMPDVPKHKKDKRAHLAAVRYVKRKVERVAKDAMTTVQDAVPPLPQVMKRLASQLSPRKLREHLSPKRKRQCQGRGDASNGENKISRSPNLTRYHYGRAG
jgi:hypothetical protein